MVRRRFPSCVSLSSPTPFTNLFSFSFLLDDAISALGYLHLADVSSVAYISEVHTVSIFLDPEDGGGKYLRSIAALLHLRSVKLKELNQCQQ
jgi:hypothetical protein